MKHPRLNQGAIWLGVLVFLVGLLYQFTLVLGSHPFRATIAINVGATLVVVGLVRQILGNARNRARRRDR